MEVSAKRMLSVIAEVAEAVQNWKMQTLKPKVSFGCVGDTKVNGGWSFCVAKWDKATQDDSLPKGVHWAYDGAANGNLMIVHLTPEIAERIFKCAEAHLRTLS
jgi:hypothetical protein